MAVALDLRRHSTVLERREGKREKGGEGLVAWGRAERRKRKREERGWSWRLLVVEVE